MAGMADTVPERLREAMALRGVDQSQLAAEVGVTQGTISLILMGKTRRSRHLPAVARALGVSLEWLSGFDADRDSFVSSARISADERALVENFRQLRIGHRHAVNDVIEAFRSTTLPTEDALSEAFEAVLLASPEMSRGELARELARRLPIVLQAAGSAALSPASAPASAPDALNQDHDAARRGRRRA